MSNTVTLPDANHTDSALISDLKRHIKDRAWTGNAGNGRFHFCFESPSDCTTAKQRLQALKA